MTLKRLSENKQKSPTLVLLYGGAGAGKTYWSASAPNAVILTDGNGIITVKSKGWKEAHPNVDPFVIELRPDESPTAPQAFDSMRNQLDELFTAANLPLFETIVIDDIDFTRIAARNKGVTLNGLLNRSKTSTNMRSGAFKDIIVQTEADFGTEMNLVDTFLLELTSACRQYGKNLIVCAHERYYMRNDDKGNSYIESVKPLFTGQKTPDNVTRYFDLVWYVKSIGAGTAIKREFITDQESYYPCKTRWSKLFKNPERDLTAAQVFKRISDYQDSLSTPSTP